MSDEFHFNGKDDAKAEIRAAVHYLLKSAVGSDRGDIVREIIAIVNEVTRGLPPDRQDPLDDGMPGGKYPPAKPGALGIGPLKAALIDHAHCTNCITDGLGPMSS